LGFKAPEISPNYSRKIKIEGVEDLGYAARLAFRVLTQVYKVVDLSLATFKENIPGAAPKTAKRTTAKKAESKVQRANTKGRERSANIEEEPFFFEVDESGTISSSNFKEPKINSDMFDNISIDRLTTPEDIIGEVEFPYDALVDHFRWLAQVEREELMRRIELKNYCDERRCSG
jgi:hypothetical protein